MNVTITKTYTARTGNRGIVGKIDGRSFSRFIRRGESPADAVLRIWSVDIAADLDWGDGLDLCRTESLTDSGEVITEQMRGAKAWLGAITGRCERWGLRREFVRGQSNLSRSGRGNRWWSLSDIEDGAYEASSCWRSMTEHRTFFVIRGGRVAVIEKRDALLFVA